MPVSNNKEWQQIGTAGEYLVWKLRWKNMDMFNLTKDGPPKSIGGYFELKSILMLKGVSDKFIPKD